MGRYSHVRSLNHAQRILRTAGNTVRDLSRQADAEGRPEDAIALRGKAVAYSEAADLVNILERKFAAGELDENQAVTA